jgi:hypothetical protein
MPDRILVGVALRSGDMMWIAARDKPESPPVLPPVPPIPGGFLNGRSRRFIAILLVFLSFVYTFAGFVCRCHAQVQLPPPYEMQKEMVTWRYMAAINYALNPWLQHPALEPAMNFQHFVMHSNTIAHIPIYTGDAGTGLVARSNNPVQIAASVDLSGTEAELILQPLVQNSFTANCVCRPLWVTVYRGPALHGGGFYPIPAPLDEPRDRADLFIDIIP